MKILSSYECNMLKISSSYECNMLKISSSYFQGIVFIWTQTYREIFKSALVYLKESLGEWNSLSIKLENMLPRFSCIFVLSNFLDAINCVALFYKFRSLMRDFLRKQNFRILVKRDATLKLLRKRFGKLNFYLFLYIHWINK